MKNKNQKKRLLFMIFLASAVSLVLLGRFFFLMVLRDSPEKGPGGGKAIVERGNIFDRKGRILAITTQLHTVNAWTPYVNNPAESARLLAEILDLDESHLLKRLKQDKKFLYIKRKISSEASARVRALKSEKKLMGISLETEFGRSYPEKELASHILGYVGTDNRGLSGIEWAYDSFLSPDEKDYSIIHGNHLFLTLDLNIQYFARKTAESLLKSYQAKSVSILVADAQNGELLACSSLPDFNPNIFHKYSADLRTNRMVTLAYEPGSVFKIFSISSFLQYGELRPQDKFNCRGYYEEQIGNELFHLKCQGVHGLSNARRVLMTSCNAGAAAFSGTISPRHYYQALKRFGFGQETEIGLGGESPGILKKPETWSGRTGATMAIGQEIAVTPLQIIQAASALSNQGIRLQLSLVKKIVAPDGRILQEAKRTEAERVLSEDIAALVMRYLEDTASEDGTASKASIPGIRTAAKTGTAQVLDRKTGRYSEREFIASCLAIYPIESPRIMIYIIIDYPKGERYFGGQIAAPAVPELAAKINPYLGISSKLEDSLKQPDEISVAIPAQVSIGSTMPDLRGYAKRQIIHLLSRPGLEIKIIGNGWVYRQSPAPGTALSKKSKIILELQ